MVANKPICTNVYDNEFQQPLRCCILCNSLKTISFHINNHSRIIAITATVANGAVRLSIGLRLVGFIHVFQKDDANGHHKVESVAKNFIFESTTWRHAAVLDLFSKCQ